jgi:hypothetical protein
LEFVAAGRWVYNNKSMSSKDLFYIDVKEGYKYEIETESDLVIHVVILDRISKYWTFQITTGNKQIERDTEMERKQIF